MILRFTAPWKGKRIYVSFNTKFETWNYTDTGQEGLQYIRISQKAMKEILLSIDFNCWNYTSDLSKPTDKETLPEAPETDEIPLF